MSSITTRLPAICSLIMVLVAPVAHAADFVAMSGPQLYTRFCGSCHGVSGRGDGPVSKALRVEVPDLTLLMRRQGNAFSRERLEKIIDGRFLVGAHGTRDMPIWGENFSRVELGNPDADRGAALMISRLADHVESLQRSNTKTPAK